MVEQEKLDNLMLELDGTENKCKPGLGESGEAGGGGHVEQTVWSAWGGFLRKDCNDLAHLSFSSRSQNKRR